MQALRNTMQVDLNLVCIESHEEQNVARTDPMCQKLPMGTYSSATFRQTREMIIGRSTVLVTRPMTPTEGFCRASWCKCPCASLSCFSFGQVFYQVEYS